MVDISLKYISNQTTTKVLSYQPKMVLKTINWSYSEVFQR